jgi:hypothetical protein
MSPKAAVFTLVAALAIHSGLWAQQCNCHGCVPSYYYSSQDLYCAGSCSLEGKAPSNCPICKWQDYVVTFPDGQIEYPNLYGSGARNLWYGGCSAATATVYDPHEVKCWPQFYTPTVSPNYFYAESYDNTVTVMYGTCGLFGYNWNAVCSPSPAPGHIVTVTYTCFPDNCCQSPIIVDTEGNGFSLSDAAHGVDFDFYGSGSKIRLAWTTPGSDDAWLVLDRDGNGAIDSAREMFGNVTEQHSTTCRNGFLALAEFDVPEHGGNTDGVIDTRDAVFTQLRLWRDSNHNGISEPNELLSLAAAGISAISLDYKEAKVTDVYGNQFRYRTKIDDSPKSHVTRWIYDVFLTR